MKTALTRVIGIGQPNAGDDYVGIAVARALSGKKVRAGAEIHAITDAALLVELLVGCRRAILIDALVSKNAPGKIMRLSPEEVAAEPVTLLSSHGMGIADAIRLAHTLAPAATDCDIHIIGITTELPAQYTHTLSTPVAAAVPRAANLILKLLEGKSTLTCA